MTKPPKVNPWDRRPWPTQGDESDSKTYEAVGRALSQWERLEARLAILFASFVSPFDSFAARRAYVAVRTFEGRAEMLRAATSAYFGAMPNSELEKRYKNILSNVTSFAPRRNEIAHGVVSNYKDAKGLKYDFNAYALYPSWASFKERALDGTPSYCVTSKEILYFEQHFISLELPIQLLKDDIGIIWDEEHASRYTPVTPDPQ